MLFQKEMCRLKQYLFLEWMEELRKTKVGFEKENDKKELSLKMFKVV